MNAENEAPPKSSLMAFLKQLRPDMFTMLLIGCVILASFLPVRGAAAPIFGVITKAAIILLFFMHGAKLSRESVLQGLSAWKVHGLVLSSTFVIFPIFALLLTLFVPNSILPDSVKQGIVFIGILPSTVQSSIALTSIGKGNIAAAVCTASLSNILGVFITPVLAGLIMASELAAGSGNALSAIGNVALILLAPFIVGHLSRPVTAKFVAKHKGFLTKLDRGSILLVVYTAFSAAVVEGLWSRVSFGSLLIILLANGVLLSAVLMTTRLMAKIAGLSTEDEVTLVMCGSKKSLASGVPMAAALFTSAQAGPIILPLMFFHQLQLIVCAFIARRYGQRDNA